MFEIQGNAEKIFFFFKRSRGRIFNQCLIIKVQNKFHTNSFPKIAKRSHLNNKEFLCEEAFFPIDIDLLSF
jgi:hypothetical protein